MLHRLTDLFPKGAAPKPALPPTMVRTTQIGSARSNAKPTYSKVFRYTADAQHKHPHSVEVVGSFTDWRPVPLAHHGAHHGQSGHWQANIENIEGNKTHHYMVLVDGKPATFPHSDGYAKPEGMQEERYAIETVRGPRVYMLFAQTK